MAVRLIQNFRGLLALWGAVDAPPDALRATLGRLGVSIGRFEACDPSELAADRHILFIDGDFLFDAGLVGQPGRIMPAVPAIGLVGVEAPSRLKALWDAGCTAFLRKPVHPGTVYSSLFLAVNNHARFNRIETDLAEQTRRRNGRRWVVKAVIDLVVNAGMSDDDAYAHLRREAMRRRVGVEDFAERFVRARDGAQANADSHDQPKQESSNG